MSFFYLSRLHKSSLIKSQLITEIHTHSATSQQHQKQKFHSSLHHRKIKTQNSSRTWWTNSSSSNPNRFSTTQSTQIRIEFLINYTIQQQISPRTNQTVSNSQSIASRFNKIVSNFRDSQRFFKESSSSNLRILPAIPTVRWSQERFRERRGEERSNSKLNKRRRKIRFETEQEKKRNTFICSKQRRNVHQKQTTKLYFKLLRSNLRIKQR